MRELRFVAVAILCFALSPATAQTAPRIGPTFADELTAAGCANEVGWMPDGTFMFGPGADRSCAQRVLAAHDPTKAPVPRSVTRLQGRLQLAHAGLLGQAEASVTAAGGDLAIWYADAQTWHRDDAHVLAIGAALGLSPAQIDGLFIAAGSIT